MTQWVELNKTRMGDNIITEKIIESPMGFFFLRETHNVVTGLHTETMSHIQCNRVQFRSFLEQRIDRNLSPMEKVRIYNRGRLRK